jgi:hypothetical protein
MVTIHFMTGYSLSPVNLKIYYGSQLQTYTNYIIASLSANNIVTTTYAAYDQVQCKSGIWSAPHVDIPIDGLILGQQFFDGITLINSNSVESPFLSQAVCGFTVTNNIDQPLSPNGLRISN